MITTITETAKVSPELLRNTIDRRIVKIRPMSTPVDQISRMMGARRASSMEVEYYSVDTKLTETTTKAACDLSDATDRGNGTRCLTISVDNSAIFEPSETILFPDCPAPGQHIVGYVLGTGSSGSNIDFALVADGEPEGLIPAGTRVIRMGRAAAELDVQTAQFQALPTKGRNRCQIFKMQVEQSMLLKLADKEVGWTLSDQEEVAIIDMRLGMEKNFIFGHGAKIFDPAKSDYIYLTQGIWNQTDNIMKVDAAKLTHNDLIDICAATFTGNNGSHSKILLAGTDFVSAVSKLDVNRTLDVRDAKVRWGLEVREIVSNFGRLYLIHSEVFDQCGHGKDAFILDPDYITKYVHIPFHAEKLDLRSAGTRNTDAVVLTEASCLVLRHPKAHMKILG